MKKAPLVLVPFLVVACVSESSDRTAPRVVDGGVSLPPATCSRALTPAPALGFARHVSGDIVAFDTATGHQLKRHTLGSEVVDLAWDRRTSRLLATTKELFDVEGSRVHALTFDGSEITHEASSEVFPGEIRVLPSPTRVIVVGVELGSEWYELDDDLAIVGQSGALPQPLLVGEPQATSLLALRREAQADVVYRVSGFAQGWSSVELTLPPRGVVIATTDQRSWFLGREDSTSFEVASLPATSLSTRTPLVFHAVPTSCARGALQSMAVDAAGCALVTVTGTTSDQLAVVPTFPGEVARCIGLGAPLARSSAWIPRNLVVDRGGRTAWVATEQGVKSFALDPVPKQLPSFVGSELEAPMSLAF
jgi:hypothetical protein